MLLVDLLDVVFEKRITIYEGCNNKDVPYGMFKDLYSGTVENVPSDLMLCKVYAIGAKQKGHLDIQIDSSK